MKEKQKKKLVILLSSIGIFSSGLVATKYVDNLSTKEIKALVRSLSNSKVEKAIYADVPTNAPRRT